MNARRLSLCVACVALLASVVTVAAAQTEEALRLAFSRAELLQRSGDPEGAIAALDRLILAAQQQGMTLSEEGRLMLRRSYELRASLHWDAGRRSATDADLDAMIELDPAYEPAAVGHPQALRERFQQRRERKVGYLRIGLFPVDATVSVNGRDVESLPDLLPVLAGEHEVTARKPGHAPATETVAVRANRTVGVGFELARASATIRLATRPAGAKLVVDGDVIGSTPPAVAGGDDAGAGPASEPLLIEGLLPGWHEIEVTLSGYRPFRQRIEVPDLSDYDLGVLELARAEGIVLLRGLVADANVLVDGQPATPTADLTGAGNMPRLVLPVGEHDLVIERGPAGSFESRLSIEEGRTITIDVELRPAIAWLGAFGGDALDRDAVRSMVVPALQRSGWTLLEREADGAALLDLTGITPGDLQQESEAAAQLRAAVRARLRAGLYVLAVLPAERPAASLQLWLWGADGAAAAARLDVELGMAEALEPLSAALQAPLPAERAWLGAQLADSQLRSGILVLDVWPSGPAAQAGLLAGERIVALDGVAVGRVAELLERLRTALPFETLVLDVESNDGAFPRRVTLGSGPWVPGPSEWSGIDAVSWAALAAERGSGTSSIPDWALAMDLAMLALRGGEPGRAAELLSGLDVPAAGPFGRGAVDYWLGVALLAAGDDQEAGMAALRAAAAASGARLSHNDGPLLAPAALARLPRPGR